METDYEREVRLVRQTEGDKRWLDCWAKKREIEDYAGETDRENSYRWLSKVIFPLKYLTSGFFLLTFIGETSITIPWTVAFAIFTDLHVFIMHAQLHTPSSYNHTFLCVLSGLPHNDYHSLVILKILFVTIVINHRLCRWSGGLQQSGVLSVCLSVCLSAYVWTSFLDN